MTDIFSPKFDILPTPQKALWENLAPTKELGYVLYGGTAIALQLGHRQSVDFDFFSDIDLNHQTLYKNLPFLNDATVTQQEENTLSFAYQVQVDDKPVKLSFFGGIGFGRVSEPLMTEDEILVVANLQDLLATKLATVMSRVEIKDYLDIAALIDHGLDLEKGLEHTTLLYGKSFSPAWCLKTLTYFDDDRLQSIPEQVREILRNACKQIDLTRPRTNFPETLISYQLSNINENTIDIARRR